MKFLLDQDVYAITTRFLRELGHDVVTARELSLSTAPDDELLKRAEEEQRILVTRDKDFGALVYAQRLGKGVIFLRISPSTVMTTHAELEKLLETRSEAELSEAFTVVEPGQHRFRRLS